MSAYIRTKAGVPAVRDFQSSEGTPIVINTITNIAYYLGVGNIVRPIMGAIDVAGAFSDGFSLGFS